MLINIFTYLSTHQCLLSTCYKSGTGIMRMKSHIAFREWNRGYMSFLSIYYWMENIYVSVGDGLPTKTPKVSFLLRTMNGDDAVDICGISSDYKEQNCVGLRAWVILPTPRAQISANGIYSVHLWVLNCLRLFTRVYVARCFVWKMWNLSSVLGTTVSTLSPAVLRRVFSVLFLWGQPQNARTSSELPPRNRSRRSSNGRQSSLQFRHLNGIARPTTGNLIFRGNVISTLLWSPSGSWMRYFLLFCPQK